MMNNKLSEIENWLFTPSVFDFLKSVDIDSALDSRDETNFDSCWMKEFDFLESVNIQNEDMAYINYLREKAFKFSFRVINNAEISSHVSDDVELISKSFVIGKNDSWAILYLWSFYKEGKFPQ
jgi:hypothetical protein